VPQRLVTRLIPGNRLLAMATCASLGLVFPICECGIVPIIRRLLMKGLPLSCAIAYLLAGPVVNLLVLLSTIVAFVQFGPAGYVVIGLRMVLGFLVALGTAWVVQRVEARHGVMNLLRAESLPPKEMMSLAGPGGLEPEDWDPHAGQPLGPAKRLANILAIAMVDFIDIFSFLILGALIATTVRIGLGPDTISELASSHPLLVIAAMIGLAIVVCLCSEADAFVAASFAGIGPAAKLAFLVTGPMLDFKLFVMYLNVFKPRLIRVLVLSIILQIFVYCAIAHVAWQALGPR
jgi:hypothetical protein